MQAVWIISTPLGDAVRSRYDADEVEGHIRLKASSCTQFIPQEPPMRLVTVGQYAPSDMPDYGKRDTEISNVCGFVAGFSSLYDRHPAWRNVRSTLGYFREAYSLRGGNLLFLRGKLIFKGATSRKGVYDTVVRLVSEPTEPVLKAYLIIATAYMRRNLFVHGGCLLEEMLSQFAWCRVMHRCGMSCARALNAPDPPRRHEEMSNAVIFYINDWTTFRLPRECQAPDMGTVTVSRRGIVNVRLGWHNGVSWEGNEEWVALVDSVRDFLLTLC